MTISGLAIDGRVARAQSRAAASARKRLSVPPDVITPVAAGGACRMSSVQSTTSSSNFLRLGNAFGPSAFSEKKRWYASFATASTSSPA